MKNDGWIKKSSFQHTRDEFLTEHPSLPANIRGALLGPLPSCFRFHAKGAEDPGIQTDQSCYLLLGSSGLIYKSSRSKLLDLPSLQENIGKKCPNARKSSKHLWTKSSCKVLAKRWGRAIYQPGLLFLKPPEHAGEGHRLVPTWRDCCRQVSGIYKSPQVLNLETSYGWEAYCIQKNWKDSMLTCSQSSASKAQHYNFHLMIHQSKYVPTRLE